MPREGLMVLLFPNEAGLSLLALKSKLLCVPVPRLKVKYPPRSVWITCKGRRPQLSSIETGSETWRPVSISTRPLTNMGPCCCPIGRVGWRGAGCRPPVDPEVPEVPVEEPPPCACAKLCKASNPVSKTIMQAVRKYRLIGG